MTPVRLLRLLAVLLAAGAGCSSKGSDNAPQLQDVSISATTVAFPGTFPGFSRTSTLVLTNVGQLTASVSLTALPGLPFTVTFVPALPATLNPQEVLTISITFTPGSEAAFGAALILGTDVPGESSITVTLSGTGTVGTIQSQVLGGFGAFSRTLLVPPDRAVFAATGPDLLAGTPDDLLVSYDASSNIVQTLNIPVIAQAPIGGNGSRVLVPAGGADLILGTADDELVEVDVQDGGFTTNSTVVGALTAGVIGRPLGFSLRCAAVATGGPDLAFGTADDTLAIVKFNPLPVVVTQVPVGAWGTALASRPHSAADGSIAFCLPGGDLAFMTADDELRFVRFNIADASLVSNNVAVVGPLDPVLAEVRVFHPDAGLQIRPGPDLLSGTADDLLVAFGVTAAGLYASTVANPRTGVEIVSQPQVFFGNNEIAILTAGPDGVSGSPDDLLLYILLTSFSLVSTTPAPFAGVGTPTFSQIVTSLHGSPLVTDGANVAIGMQILAMGVGLDGVAGTTDDVLVFQDVTNPGGPIVTTSINAGRMDLAGRPAILSSEEWSVSAGLGPDATPRTADDVLRVINFRDPAQFSIDRSLPGIDDSVLSRALRVTTSSVVVLTAGADGIMNTADDALRHVTLPIP